MAAQWDRFYRDELQDKTLKSGVKNDVQPQHIEGGGPIMTMPVGGFVRSQPTAMILDIDPAAAQTMLNTSIGNRRVRQWYVGLLAGAMARGEWRVTSQGIGFDAGGHLRDAHHRLHAVIKSGVTIRTVVVFGLRDDAYEVIDTGMRRTYADLLNTDQRIAEVLRLGCQYVLATNKPTIDQMRPIIASGLADACRELLAYCGTTRRYFSSAPMKLAACITIMGGGNAEYVLKQYRALCTLDFELMSPSGQALLRQVDKGVTRAADAREVIARGLCVFDEGRRNVSKIQIVDASIDAAIEYVKRVLCRP